MDKRVCLDSKNAILNYKTKYKIKNTDLELVYLKLLPWDKIAENTKLESHHSTLYKNILKIYGLYEDYNTWCVINPKEASHIMKKLYLIENNRFLTNIPRIFFKEISNLKLIYPDE